MTFGSVEELLPRPSVMGVLNVTPDSFSDGGLYLDPGRALERAAELVAEGARIVDVGGESTRPGSEGVTADEELERVLPVLERLGRAGIPFSIDTAKAEVAEKALELGAVMVNDVTALRGDPRLAGVVAGSGALLCLMHMQGAPRTMQDAPSYGDVVVEVRDFLAERLEVAGEAGIALDRVCVDPGIGFGKTVAHNLRLIRRLEEIAALGRPVLVGVSRKRFLARVLGDLDSTVGTLHAGVAVAVTAFLHGASIFRVHDVREHVEALAAARAVEAVT